MLDNATEAVAMGCDYDVFAGLNLRYNNLIPERQGTSDGVLQALTDGKLTLFQTLVSS